MHYKMRPQQACNATQQTDLALFGRPSPAQLLLCAFDLSVAFQLAALPALLRALTWPAVAELAADHVASACKGAHSDRMDTSEEQV